jgi:hypothetical protein
MILGGAKGLMKLPDDFDVDDALIEAMFNEAIKNRIC